MNCRSTGAGRGPVFTVAALFSLLAAGLFVSWWYFTNLGLGCDSGERAVYEEFPQFEDRRIEPQTNQGFGTCWARYETRQSRQEVQDYYARKLKANGWTVVRKPSPEELAPPEETVTEERVPGEPGKTRKVPMADAGALISAERGDYYYQVEYYSLQDFIEPRPGLEIMVNVDRE